MNSKSTNIYQGLQFLDWGLDPKTADMSWHEDLAGEHLLVMPYLTLHEELEDLRKRGPVESTEYPAWSLTALLEMLPDIISDNEKQAELFFTKKRNNDGMAYTYGYHHPHRGRVQ